MSCMEVKVLYIWTLPWMDPFVLRSQVGERRCRVCLKNLLNFNANLWSNYHSGTTLELLGNFANPNKNKQNRCSSDCTIWMVRSN